MCCSLSRPGRSTLESGRWRKMCRAVEMLTCLYSSAGEPCMVQATCVQWEAPTPLSTRDKWSQQTAKILYNIVWFCTCEPTSLQEPFIGPSLKAMRTLLIRPIQGYRKLLPLLPRHLGERARLPPFTLQYSIYFLCPKSLFCPGQYGSVGWKVITCTKSLQFLFFFF